MRVLLIFFILLLLRVSSWSMRLPAWKFSHMGSIRVLHGAKSNVAAGIHLSSRLRSAVNDIPTDVPISSEYEMSLLGTGAEDVSGADEKSIPKLINNIIDNVLIYSSSNKDLSGFDPHFLLENAHIITSGRIYESTMNDRMEAAREGSGEALTQLEKVDALLQGFVIAERKQRARLKVTYVLAGAESGRLNEGIALLSESGEIDDDLMKYLDRVIKKELLKAMGPGATLSEDGSSDADSSIPDREEESLEAGVKATLSVLRMVQKLLQAELKTQKRTEVRLLSALLEEKDPEARYIKIKTALTKIEQLEEFAAFITEGIVFLKARESNDRNRDSLGEHETKKEVQLPVGVVEQMKDILLDVQAVLDRLKTGMHDGDVYSTDKGDYADKGPY